MKTPSLTTNRLIIRPINPKDAEDYFEFAKLPDVGPKAGWSPHESIHHTKMIIDNMNYFKPNHEPRNFSIILKETNKMIGTIELYHFTMRDKQAELGYCVSPIYQNQGIATEACECILKFGFEELNLVRIEASAYVDNIQSIRVCEKIGLKKEGILRKSYLSYDNKIYDRVVFAMTDEDYNRKKASNEN